MTNHQPRVVTLADACDLTVDEVGAKVAALAAVRSADIEVPDGFVVLSTTLERAWAAAGVVDRLDRLWSATLDTDTSDIAHIAREARRIIHGVSFDADLKREIIDQYHALGADASVAVRASAAPVAGERPHSSGVLAAHLGVVGDDAVLAHVRSCWASVFGERSLTMSAQRLRSPRPSVAVLVQRMVHAERSGLLAPMDESGELAIEATFGLSEPILTGAVEPDRYLCDRQMELIHRAETGSKQIVFTTTPNSIGHVFSSDEQRECAVLDQDRVARLCRLSARVDHRLGGPHEIEWASTGDTDSVIQVRPIKSGFGDHSGQHFGVPGVLSGVGVGVGAAQGRVRIIAHGPDAVDSADADFRSTDILVATSTDPTWSPVIGRVAGVVTDLGDAHSHAALVCRRLGIPAVVGTRRATTALHDGLLVTVDAARGWVIPHHET